MSSETKAVDVKTNQSDASKQVKREYGWEELHDDLQNELYCGVYGGANSAWHGLAELRANVNLYGFHKKRSPDEFFLPNLDKHLKNSWTRRRWNDIVSIDPLGMYGTPPTMSAVNSSIVIPELRFEPDPKIVNNDGSANVTKIAIDYAWNIAGVADRLKMDESKFRSALSKYCQNDRILDKKYRAFLPPLGGLTVYCFGDIGLLSEQTTEVAVRVHDSCCGSDVFGTDICTCRPYLVFALKAAVECAQRGGVGLIIYFQKEGRSLGEVTKFRVYNARKAQKGGDVADKYFYQTESIAGIRDARFQEMMPDILLFLGIDRIDWLLSMSSDKYEAISNAGINVMQRVALPDMFVPRNAHVEISAKISAGYHTDALNSGEVVNELRTLDMVRKRCGLILELAKQGKTKHFELDLSKMEECAKFVADLTKKTYPDLNIPYHSRWRHFKSDDIKQLTENWPCDAFEKARRLIDLVTISVLLDAGAGPNYKYTDNEGAVYTRSEGIAMASLDMFKDGLFSSDIALPERVNSHGLRSLTYQKFERGFQLNKHNVIEGAKGRYKLLQRLSYALDSHSEFFGKEVCRPGNIVDYVLKHAKTVETETKDEKGEQKTKKVKKVSVRVVWNAVITGYEGIWPENLSGVRRGDVWVYNPLKKPGQVGSDMIPFHKLSQWLTYSLLEPIESLGIEFEDTDLLTGLAEYRNGGLFVDFEVIKPINPVALKMKFDIGSELLVEWRALTICLLDICSEYIRKILGMNQEQLPLAKVLQGGTWSAGRLIASQRREGGNPPILVRSDGTVF